MTALIQPMKGLTQLTTRQVLDLDAKIRSVCAFTESTGDEVQLPIIIKAGRPVKIGQPMLLEKFRPVDLQ